MAFSQKPWLIIRRAEAPLFSVCCQPKYSIIETQRVKWTNMGSSKTRSFVLVCAILAVHVALSSSAALDFAGDLDSQLGAFFLPSESGCRGSIAECSLLAGDGDDIEFMMDSESNRRILAGRRYISYGALRRNTVPCSRRGASYYNCRPGAQANPYRRGCSAITRCRRWSSSSLILSHLLLLFF